MIFDKYLGKEGFDRLGEKLKSRILNTTEEINANTKEDMYAGALALKEVNNSLVSNIYVNDDGKLTVTKGGADTVLNFKRVLAELFKVQREGMYIVSLYFKNYGATKMNMGRINFDSAFQIYGSNDNSNYTLFLSLSPGNNIVVDVSEYSYVKVRLRDDFGNIGIIDNITFS